MKDSAFRLCVLCALCAQGCAGPNRDETVRVRWVNEAGGAARVEVTGLGAAQPPQSLLRVYAVSNGSAPDDNTPAMAGSYRVEGSVTLFEPQFPPEPGVTYRAVVRSGGLRVAADFTAPRDRA